MTGSVTDISVVSGSIVVVLPSAPTGLFKSISPEPILKVNLLALSDIEFKLSESGEGGIKDGPPVPDKSSGGFVGSIPVISGSSLSFAVVSVPVFVSVSVSVFVVVSDVV